MSLFLVAAPSTDPLSVDDAKAHLRVEVADDDPLILTLIQAAVAYTETCIHRKLLTQTWDLKLDTFPGDLITLPFPPVTAVTAITYLDTAGTSTTWAASNYRTALPVGPQAAPAWIAPGYGLSYPATYGVREAVTVTFECGYGAATDVPAAIQAALKLLVAHLYDQRAPVNVGNLVTPLPLTVEALLWPFKAF